MKAVLALVFVAIAVVAARPEESKYTTKFDDIDLDAVLNNERLMKNHHECLMDRGPCTKEGQELKNVIADALKTKCAGCSEKQRVGARKVLKFIVVKYKDNFEELKSKYDPEGKYIEEYREEAEKEGIKL